MAQWAKIRALRLYDAVSPLYGDNFPLEIRGAIATWLEQYIFGSGIDPDNPQHATYTQAFYIHLLEQLQSQISKIDESDDSGLFFRKSLIAAQNSIKRYSTDTASLYKILQYCLQQEQHAILEAEKVKTENRNSPAALSPASVNKEGLFRSHFDALGNQKQSILTCVQNMKTAMEQAAIDTNDLVKQNALITQAQCHHNGLLILNELNARKMAIEQRLSQNKGCFVYNSDGFDEQTQKFLIQSSDMQKQVIEEILSWKDEQRLKANGVVISPMPRTLDTIQEWCSELSSSHMNILQLLKEVEKLKQNMNVPDGGHLSLKESFILLVKDLVRKSFVVECQPQQVIQTKTKFATGITVRLLVGSTLNQYLTPEVVATLIGESQAYALHHQELKQDLYQVSELAPLTNCKSNMKFDGKRRFAAEFSNVKMPDKIPRRGNRTPLELVAEEKACLHFGSMFSVGELNIPIWTISLPIGVTVHKSQEPQAWGTITWDNHFARRGRLPFQVSSREPWEEVEKMLDTKFASKTGRNLTAENKSFLRQKINSNDGFVTWSMFYKDELPGTLQRSKDNKEPKGFTYWQWFYAIVELIESKCKDLWQAGRIEGFISKDYAEKKLQEKPAGTFLIRFSDSKLGGITIAWKHSDEKVYSVQPYVAAELETKSLHDRVNDLQHLQFLYPDIPKTIAFETKPPELLPRSVNSIPTIKTGYVKRQLNEAVPDVGVNSTLFPKGHKLLSAMTPPYSTSPSPSPFSSHGHLNPYSPMSEAYSYGSPSSASNDSFAYSNENLIKELDEMLDKSNDIDMQMPYGNNWK